MIEHASPENTKMLDIRQGALSGRLGRCGLDLGSGFIWSSFAWRLTGARRRCVTRMPGDCSSSRPKSEKQDHRSP
jgi:hypothetical protein